MIHFWDKYPNFSHDEVACRHCGVENMDPEFMDALQRLRTEFGEPLRVTSGYRCEIHNRNVGGSPRHVTGRAADIAMDAKGLYRLRRLPAFRPFTGIGVRMHGACDKRFIHLDMCRPEDGVETDIEWTYDKEK